MPDHPLVLNKRWIDESPTLRDLYLRRQRAQKVLDGATGAKARDTAQALVEVLDAEIYRYLGNRTLVIEQEDD